MASGAIFDLLRKNPNFGNQAFSSIGLFSGRFAGVSSAAAATSFAVATPFAFRAVFGDISTQIAYCDAGAILGEDFSSSTQTASGNTYVGTTLGEDYSTSRWTGNIFQNDALRYNVKQYDIPMKPLLSAFHWKVFALTSLRSLAQFYLPLLEPRPPMEEDGDDFLDQEEHQVDLVEPFKRSVIQIICETSVTTTRRIFERLAVHYASQRMAWKLLKDVPKSAIRKAGRGLPTVLTSNLKVEGAFDLLEIARSTPGADLAALANKAGNLAMKRIIDKGKAEMSREQQKDEDHSEDWWKQPWSDEEMENLSIAMADFEEGFNLLQKRRILYHTKCEVG